MDIHRQATQIGSIRFDRGAEEGEVRSTKKGQVLERQIPINPTQPLSATTKQGTYAIETSKSEIRNSPQRNYHEFMSFDQAGPATIAYDSSYTLYAIKKHRCAPDKKPPKVQLFQHGALVSVKDLFWRGDEIHVVYEYMDISLQQILSTPRGHLAASEVAVICKQVLSGLFYLHNMLLLSHGHLQCGQLLLDRHGRVKIANVGQSMFSNDSTAREKDIKNIGNIMMEIMEPATFLTNPNSIDLRYPERWKDNLEIKSFLSATATSDLVQLQGHKFLREPSDDRCLVPHVLMAQVSAKTDWRIFTPTAAGDCDLEFSSQL